ncbi:MAG TPA: hypothetical protein VK610_06600 [Rhodothermales bacterium]|nr:hypothetical protein [Rhodothermales bacterium]
MAKSTARTAPAVAPTHTPAADAAETITPAEATTSARRPAKKKATGPKLPEGAKLGAFPQAAALLASVRAQLASPLPTDEWGKEITSDNLSKRPDLYKPLTKLSPWHTSDVHAARRVLRDLLGSGVFLTALHRRASLPFRNRYAADRLAGFKAPSVTFESRTPHSSTVQSNNVKIDWHTCAVTGEAFAVPHRAAVPVLRCEDSATRIVHPAIIQAGPHALAAALARRVVRDLDEGLKKIEQAAELGAALSNVTAAGVDRIAWPTEAYRRWDSSRQGGGGFIYTGFLFDGD